MTDQTAIPSCPVCGREICDCSEEAQREALARIEAGVDPLVDASNPTQIAARTRAKKQDADQGKNDMNWLMRHPQGRRIMWGLLEKAGIFRNAFVATEGQTNQMCFNLGANNLGLGYYITAIQQEPDGFNLMVKENSGRLER